jgi:hypothetical protein
MVSRARCRALLAAAQVSSNWPCRQRQIDTSRARSAAKHLSAARSQLDGLATSACPLVVVAHLVEGNAVTSAGRDAALPARDGRADVRGDPASPRGRCLRRAVTPAPGAEEDSCTASSVLSYDASIR